MGLYSVLWGKYKEYKEKEEEVIQEVVKQGTCADHHHTSVSRMATVKEEVEANDDIEMQKTSTTESANDGALAPVCCNH